MRRKDPCHQQQQILKSAKALTFTAAYNKAQEKEGKKTRREALIMQRSPTKCYKILISLVEGETKRQKWKDSEAKEALQSGKGYRITKEKKLDR